jgi:hypothetical protein
MTSTNLRKKATIRTSINYRVSLWDRCVPGKQEPAFAGLADLKNPPHKWNGFRIFAHNPKVLNSNLDPATYFFYLWVNFSALGSDFLAHVGK